MVCEKILPKKTHAKIAELGEWSTVFDMFEQSQLFFSGLGQVI